MAEEIGLLRYDPDSQSFLFSANGVYGFKLAALDTLQHRLAGYAKGPDRFPHWQKVWTGRAIKASLEFIREADLPRSARRHLFARDDAVINETMDGRWRDAKRFCSALNGDPLAVSTFGTKQGIFQFVRKLATRLPSKRWPRAVLRPCRLRMPAITVSG